LLEHRTFDGLLEFFGSSGSPSKIFSRSVPLNKIGTCEVYAIRGGISSCAVAGAPFQSTEPV
jgi:hypothetical protein